MLLFYHSTKIKTIIRIIVLSSILVPNILFASFFSDTLKLDRKVIHHLEIGMPFYNFHDNDGFQFTDVYKIDGDGTNRPLYISYELRFPRFGFGINRSNFVRWYGENWRTDPEYGTLFHRTISNYYLSCFLRTSIYPNKHMKLELNIGTMLSYRYRGVDQVFVQRNNPIEMATASYFYNKLGYGVLAGCELEFKNRFTVNFKYNLAYYNEGELKYKTRVFDNYHPNRFMSNIYCGLGFNIDKNLFKKSRN